MELPNITLIFQIVNFYVAYRILYYFVFAPALKILIVQDQYKKTVEQKIVMTKNEHVRIVQSQHTRWKAMKDSLYNLIPSSMLTCTLTQHVFKQKQLDLVTLSEKQKAAINSLIRDELLDVKS